MSRRAPAAVLGGPIPSRRLVGRFPIDSLRRIAGVLVLYCGASVVLLGRPALEDPQHVCACIGGGDPPAYMWALGWWPYALAHGLDPLFSHVVWFPVGANLANTALIPLPSVLAWPLTAAFGPLPAYDLLTLLSPAFAGTAMYVLCVHLTGRRLASFAGGWLFGFSTYELSQVVGHANLMLVALLPLAVLVVLLRLERRLRRCWFVLLIALLLVAQLLTSAEVLATSCGLGAVAFVVGWLRAARSQRAHFFQVALEATGGGVLAAIIASPFLYEALAHSPPPLPGAGSLGTDVASLVVPLQVSLIQYGGATAVSLPFVAEQGSYFGVPLLIAFGAALWARRRTPAAAVLAVLAALALLLSLGSTLTIAGRHTIALPWRLVEHVPVAKAAIPDRLILYMWFALAIAIAIWLATPGRFALARWALVLAGIVLILPDSGSPLFSGRPDNPPLFSTTAYQRLFPPRSVVLVLPFGLSGDSMLWQAETKFAFRMPEGYLSYAPPAAFAADPAAAALLASQTAGSQAVPASTLRTFLRRYHVNTILVDKLIPDGWPAKLATLGLKGRQVDGTIVYEITNGAPAIAKYAQEKLVRSLSAAGRVRVSHALAIPISSITPWRTFNTPRLEPLGARYHQFRPMWNPLPTRSRRATLASRVPGRTPCRA